MPIYSPMNSPEQNLAVLAENPYPGRLLVVGFSGVMAVQAYAVEGRSEGSRNRRLVIEDNVVSTEVADPSLPVGDPELTIYDAMRRVGDVHVVTNGNQTDRIIRYIRAGKTFADAMYATTYEPDEPNYTPRISGFHHFDPDEGQPYFGISVISRGHDGRYGFRPYRKLYTDQSPELDFDPLDVEEMGFAVHTYKGNGDPLPSFGELPFRVPVVGSAEEMAGMLWENLDRDNRVAVAAKTFTPEGTVDIRIINRHE